MLKHFTLIACLTVPGGGAETWPLAASSSEPVSRPALPPTYHWWDLHCYITAAEPLKERNE